MLVVFSPIFVADTEIIPVYNFVAPLTKSYVRKDILIDDTHRETTPSKKIQKQAKSTKFMYKNHYFLEVLMNLEVYITCSELKNFTEIFQIRLPFFRKLPSS